MTRASKQAIVADSARIGSTAIRRASGLLEQSDERERRSTSDLKQRFLAAATLTVTFVGLEKVMRFLDRIFGGRQREATEPRKFRELMERAVADLQAKTSGHDGAWRLSEAAWNVDMDEGTIVFTTPKGIRATAPVQIIGTYNTEDSTWLWGWDHPSVAPPLAEHAKRLLAYGQEHNIPRLTTRKLNCSEEECWKLTALACLLCDAQGGYRGPAGTAMVFMTFGEVKLSKATP